MKRVLYILGLLLGHFFIYAQNCNVNYFTGNSVYSFAESSDAWWFVTECKIVRVGKANNAMTFYKVGLDMGECIGLPAKVVANPNTNEAWVSVTGNGLYHFVNNNWQAVYTSANYTIGASGTNLIGIDNSNKLWFYNGDSLFTYSGTSFGGGVLLPANTAGIISATIDSSANIWMAVANGGVVKYNGSTFQTFDTSNCNIDNNNCTFIKYDKYDNAIWVGSNRIDSNFQPHTPVVSEFKNNTWANHVLPQGCVGVLPDEMISDMFNDSSGIWFTATGQYNGNRLIHLTDTSIFVYSPCNTSFPPPVYSMVNVVCRAMNGKLYVGSTQNGLFQVDSSNWGQYVLSNSNFLGAHVITMTADSLGHIWAGSTTDNTSVGKVQPIYYFNGTSWQAMMPPAPFKSYAAISTTYGGNLIYFSENKDYKILSYDIAASNWNIFTMSNSGTSGFSADHNNNLWISNQTFVSSAHDTIASWNGSTWNYFNPMIFGLDSSANSDISIVNKGNSTWFLDGLADLTHYDGITVNSYKIPSSIKSGKFAVDNFNKVWIAGTGDGMYIPCEFERFDGNQWYSWQRPYEILASTQADYCVYVGPDNKKYFGTNDGLFVFNDTSWVNYNTTNSNFLSNDIYYITGDNNGNIWLGTGGGITHFYPCGGQVYNITPVVLDVKQVSNRPEQISIFPNPASDEINIVNANNFKISGIAILDMSGKAVLEESDLASMRVNISALVAGLYIVQIRTDNGIYTDKLSIVR